MRPLGYGDRSAMKLIVKTLAVFSIVWAGGLACAEKTRSIPRLAELQNVVGVSVGDEEFRRMLKAYRFSENPKRDDSWGSPFGVFFAVTKANTVTVGIRPPSRSTNMPTYPGELPRGLKPEDPVATVESKLGSPKHTGGDPHGHYVMQYDGMNVVTLRERLFEVWLTSTPPKAEPSDEREPE